MSGTEIKSIIQEFPTNKVQDRFNIWNSVLSRLFREKKCWLLDSPHSLLFPAKSTEIFYFKDYITIYC